MRRRPTRTLLEALQHRNVVQWAEAAGSQERGAIGNQTIQPQPPNRERCITVAATRSRHGSSPNPDSRASLCRLAGSVASTSAAASISAPDPSPTRAVRRAHPARRRSRPCAPRPRGAPDNAGAETRAAVVVVARYVEEKPFRGAKKVRVEHGDELTGREVVWMSEEAAREDLERKVPSSRRKVKSIKEIRRTHRHTGRRWQEVDVQQLEGSRHVHAARSRSRNDGLCMTNVAMFSGGVSGILAKESA